MATLQNLKALSQDELIAMLLKAQEQPARKITAKVSEKGAMSVYGLGRFPVTLYRTQWERLLAPDTVAQLLAFIEANGSLLATKV
jgi:hypothetical protein